MAFRPADGTMSFAPGAKPIRPALLLWPKRLKALMIIVVPQLPLGTNLACGPESSATLPDRIVPLRVAEQLEDRPPPSPK